jgi:glycoside hydrolase-like protein
VCVRFDRHAVYLGQPSPDQRCPAHAVGHTEAILVKPLAAHGARSGGVARPVLPVVTGVGGQRGHGSSAELAIPARGIVVTATWAKHPGLVERALGVRVIGAMRGGATSSARKPAVRAQAASVAAGAGSLYQGPGFDACSAPSPSQMSAWESSPYRALGIYIGGTNMACSQPNLTASWAASESAAGWRLIPTYVGLQAPTNSCGCAAIDPKRASAEGSAAAIDAVNQAQALGIGSGLPIYFDMEGYTRGGVNTSAVLAFLSAWTSQLHADGYLSGVYSNANSGVSDLVATMGTGFNEPDEIWIAHWNGQQTTSDPYVPAGDWSNHQRLHQYQGGHDETYGGVTINIDSNYLDAATASVSAPFPDGTFVQVAGSGVTYRIAGGAPLYVSDWNAVGGPQPVTVISQQQFDSLGPVPRDGTFLETSTGALYRVAGGAPLYVSDWSRFGGVQPFVTIDQWNIDNITNPVAHLSAVPANGTFLTTTTGRVYRVAGGAPFAVRSWSVFGGVQPSVTVDQWDIDNISTPAAHLSGKPVDGTIVEGLPSRSYWVFKTGARTRTAAVASAIKVDDLGLAAFPGPPKPRSAGSCVVPNLRRMTLSHAQRALRQAQCRVGNVHRPRHPRRRRTLRVIKQSPRARTRHAAHYAVDVTLG